MLSDNFRILKIFVLLLAIFALGIWAVIKGPTTETTFNEALSQPEKFAGQELLFAGKIIGKEDNFLIVKDRATEVKIKGEITAPFGETISGKGVFNPQGFVEVTSWHLHKYHNLKIFASFLPTAVIFFLFHKNYRFDGKKLEFTENKD